MNPCIDSSSKAPPEHRGAPREALSQSSERRLMVGQICLSGRERAEADHSSIARKEASKKLPTPPLASTVLESPSAPGDQARRLWETSLLEMLRRQQKTKNNNPQESKR